MLDKELLKILICPENHLPLQMADAKLLARLNQAIATGKVRNRAGRAVDSPLQAGLLRQDKALLYPVVDDIPVLLVDEAILLEQVDG